MKRLRNWWIAVGLGALLALSPGPAARAQDAGGQRDLVNSGTVGIIAGGVTGTYIRIASDLANALDSGYEHRVLAIIGKGSIRNIEDLLLLKGIDLAIVQSDVLDFYRENTIYPGIEDKVTYVVKLYNEEVHLLARAEIGSVAALAGRKVNFGSQGSGTFMTASIVFEALGIAAEATDFPEPVALEKLRTGDIDALVFVGGKPLDLLQQISADEGLHLLAIPAADVRGAYLPARLTAADYPALVAPGAEIPTLAVGAVLAAYDWPPGHPRYRKVARFVARFFDNFETLLAPPYHPKWREVDLKAELPGWRRFGPAADWLRAAP